MAVILNLPNSHFAHFTGELVVICLNGIKVLLNTSLDLVECNAVGVDISS